MMHPLRSPAAGYPPKDAHQVREWRLTSHSDRHPAPSPSLRKNSDGPLPPFVVPANPNRMHARFDPLPGDCNNLRNHFRGGCGALDRCHDAVEQAERTPDRDLEKYPPAPQPMPRRDPSAGAGRRGSQDAKHTARRLDHRAGMAGWAGSARWSVRDRGRKQILRSRASGCVCLSCTRALPQEIKPGEPILRSMRPPVSRAARRGPIPRRGLPRGGGLRGG